MRRHVACLSALVVLVHLVAGDLQEDGELVLQLDWRGKLVAAIMGVQQVAPRKGIEAQPTTFKTKISTQQMENGPAPDTAAFIQRMEENKRKEEKGEVKDNRSFLAKYWMYIVPVVLFMALNGAAAPQQ